MSLNFAPFELLPQQVAEKKARAAEQARINKVSLTNFLKRNPDMREISAVNYQDAMFNNTTYYRKGNTNPPQIYSYNHNGWRKLSSSDPDWNTVMRYR